MTFDVCVRVRACVCAREGVYVCVRERLEEEFVMPQRAPTSDW